jgi:hypothetical protein
MTQLRYVPDANEAYAVEKAMNLLCGFMFNAIAVEGLLSRWTAEQVLAAIPAVFDRKTMGCDATLTAVEAHLEKLHP